MPQVAIILATYNGAQYLGEQLDSLLGQSDQNWQLWLRDDLSIDGTLELLNQYTTYDHIHLLENRGERLGALLNFSELLQSCGESDYTFFCDQDDWWLPTKVEVMVRAIRNLEVQNGVIPLLVHSNMFVVDAHRATIATSYWKYANLQPGRNQLSQLIVQNYIPGCSMIINRALRERALPVPREAAMHDWWIALVASCFGRIVALPDRLLQYRQHATNTIGATRFDQKYLLDKLRHLWDNTELQKTLEISTRQARAFYHRYASELTRPQIQCLEDFTRLGEQDFWGRRRTILKHRIFRHGLSRNTGLLLRL